MVGVDLFVVNVAFDEIGAGLGVGDAGGPSQSDVGWILSAYAIVYASLMVPAGRLADRYGQRLVFMLGLVAFTTASVWCALSGTVTSIVAARVIQAAGAATMTPSSLGILLRTSAPERRASGVRLWAMVGAFAAAVGPVAGGLLAELSWRWIFLINVPIGITLLVLALRYVPQLEPEAVPPRSDPLGAGLILIAVGFLAAGLVKSSTWAPSTTALLMATALVATVSFGLRSRRHPSPIIGPDLWRSSSLRRATAVMLVFHVGFGAALLISTLWIQQMWGWPVAQTGFVIAAGPLVVPVTSVVASRFAPRARPESMVIQGCILAALGTALLAGTMSADPSIAGFLAGWITTGVGVGLALPQMMSLATRDLAPAEAATGSAVVTMARQIGLVMGVSLVFAIVGEQSHLAARDGYLASWWAASALYFIAALVAMLTPHRKQLAMSA